VLRYFVPPRMFSRGSKGFSMPTWRAVVGMSCMRPCAPTRDTASGLNRDSVWMTARISDGDIPCVVAASWMKGSSASLSQTGRWKSVATSTEVEGSDGPKMPSPGVSMRAAISWPPTPKATAARRPAPASLTRRS
jgi:hypothetical protein